MRLCSHGRVNGRPSGRAFCSRRAAIGVRLGLGLVQYALGLELAARAGPHRDDLGPQRGRLLGGEVGLFPARAQRQPGAAGVRAAGACPWLVGRTLCWAR
jgi:hypothetical protein